MVRGLLYTWGVALLLCACGGSISGGDDGSPGASGAPGAGPGSDGESGPRSAGGGDNGEEAGGGDGPSGPVPEGELDVSGIEACAERSLPTQPLRRLSSGQYHNTLRDLFGAALAEPLLRDSLFPATQINAGFVNDAEANVVNTSESNAIEDEAERLAAQVLADPAPYARALLPCDLPDPFGDADIDACIDAFIDDFGLRAYRRPVTDNEAAIARGLYDGLRADQGATEAWSALLQFFVQSPALLYRVERGAGMTSSGLLRLSDHEMATRLSYFFLDSMPDATLFGEAAAGRLSTPDQVAAQARRLMQLPEFERALSGFHRDWLRLYELEQSGKDRDLFPDWTPEVQASLLQEPSRLVEHVLQAGDGNIASLLGSPQIPVNSVLADFYGVDAPGATEDTWVPVELGDRRGLLTLGSFMATLADAERTSPIHRGAFFQREVLCNRLPAFPGNIDTQGPLEDTSMLPTARERLSPLLQNSACMGCHAQFNPTGLALENYDAVGRWRERENGAEIDASASVTLDGTTRDYGDPLSLVEGLAHSDQVRQCYSLQWYRSALGRREFEQDACSIATAQRAIDGGGGGLRELLVAITQTDGFLYRRPTEAGEP